jgi:hypothetical protein
VTWQSYKAFLWFYENFQVLTITKLTQGISVKPYFKLKTFTVKSSCLIWKKRKNQRWQDVVEVLCDGIDTFKYDRFTTMQSHFAFVQEILHLTGVTYDRSWILTNFNCSTLRFRRGVYRSRSTGRFWADDNVVKVLFPPHWCSFKNMQEC